MSSGIYNKFTGYHNRKSIRMRDYDYSQPGRYFITICIHDRPQRLFGDVVDGKMVENEFGEIVRDEIMKTEQMRQNIKIDECMIMPNHVHMICIIRNVPDGTHGGAYCNTPLRSPDTHPRFVSPSKTIGAIVRGIKSTVQKQINMLRETPGQPVWQRNYYDRIIRDEKSLFQIRKYIRENPMNWKTDSENHIDREIQEFGTLSAGNGMDGKT